MIGFLKLYWGGPEKLWFEKQAVNIVKMKVEIKIIMRLIIVYFN